MKTSINPHSSAGHASSCEGVSALHHHPVTLAGFEKAGKGLIQRPFNVNAAPKAGCDDCLDIFMSVADISAPRSVRSLVVVHHKDRQQILMPPGRQMRFRSYIGQPVEK